MANGVLLADGEGWGFVSGPPRGSQPRAVPLWKAGVPDGSALCPGRWARRPSACPSRSPHSGTPGGPSEARLPVAPRSSVLLENSFCLSQILVEPLPCVGQCSGAGDRAAGRAGAPGAREGVCKRQLLPAPGPPGSPEVLSSAQSCSSKPGDQGHGLQGRSRLEAAEASLWPSGGGDPRRTGRGRCLSEFHFRGQWPAAVVGGKGPQMVWKGVVLLVLVARPPQRTGQACGAPGGREGPGAGMAPALCRKRRRARLPESVAQPTTGRPLLTRPGSCCSLERLEAESRGSVTRAPHPGKTRHTGLSGGRPAGNTRVRSNITLGGVGAVHTAPRSTWRPP